MREILFRGKRLDNGEWIYGYLVKWNSKARIYFEEIDEFCQTGCYLDWGKVIPETVGQYTGLNDKNGTRIFEGDILAVGEDGNVYQNVLVLYEEGAFRVSHYAINILESRNVENEVIGNIHENPSLLNEVSDGNIKQKRLLAEHGREIKIKLIDKGMKQSEFCDRYDIRRQMFTDILYTEKYPRVRRRIMRILDIGGGDGYEED